MVGQPLDHYVLQEELGQGGMSVVYRARDTVLHRDVAIKVLHPFLADRPDARRRLAREARAVAKLRHPNILEVYGYSGEDTSVGYIAMELVRGETLKQFGERQRFYPCEVAAAFTYVVAGALQHAHDNGVVHRDVKPENIMVRQDGVLKLMDFGIAHVVDAAHLTITGTLQGSPAHMAPEVIEGLDVDARADLFSLGTVLFWMACGQLPFTAKSPHALLKKIVEGRFTDPQRLNPEVSDRLAAVIRTCLAREPADRFKDANGLRAALQEVMDEGGMEDPTFSLPLFIKQPHEHAQAWAARAADRFAANAEAHLAAGDRVVALGAVNRVLALAPEHPAAATLMKRLERQSRSAGRLRVLTGTALVAGLAAAAVWVAQTVEEHAPPPAPLAAAAPPAVTVVKKPPARVEQRKPERVARRPHAATRTIQAADIKPARAPAPEPGPQGASGVTAPGETYAVKVRADPWADLEVDGTPVGKGRKVYDLDLTEGPHHLTFLHTYAQTEERDVEVKPDLPLEVRVKLYKTKPAYIKVVSATDDPDIQIDGTYKGTAAESQRVPILVPLPNKLFKTDVRIALSQKGKETVEYQRVVVAGETLEVPGTMRDLAGESREVLTVPDGPESAGDAPEN